MTPITALEPGGEALGVSLSKTQRLDDALTRKDPVRHQPPPTQGSGP